MIYTYIYKNPIAQLRIVANERELLEISTIRGELPKKNVKNRIVEEAVRQLDQYFSGEREIFNLQMQMDNYTQFQRDVWQDLIRIPCGETRSYKEIARRIGRPGAYRAVGNACGKNPFLIVVPCHRALKADGSLGGFSAGLDLKIKLLELEQNIER